MKKDFRRKLARLFGLALRSDILKIIEAYKESEEMRDHYLADLMTVTDPETNYDRKEQLVHLYNFQRQVNNCLWKGDAIGYSRTHKDND